MFISYFKYIILNFHLFIKKYFLNSLISLNFKHHLICQIMERKKLYFFYFLLIKFYF